MKSRFIQSPTYTCDFLRQSSIRELKVPADEHGPIVIHVTTTLPPYVLPYYWTLFGLRANDILHQLEHIPARLCWVSALFHGIDVSGSSLRPSLSSFDQVTLCGKPTALKKIAKTRKFPWKPDNSGPSAALSSAALSSNECKNLPPVPIVKFTPEQYSRAMDLLYASECQNKLHGTIEANDFLMWKEIPFLPVCLAENLAEEKSKILLKRVVTHDNYKDSGKQKAHGLATQPVLVRKREGKQLYAMVEDAFLAHT